MTIPKPRKLAELVLKSGLVVASCLFMDLLTPSISAQEPPAAVEVIAVPEAEQPVESQIPPPLPAAPMANQSRGTGAGRFGQAGPRSGASSSEPVYLSRETPLFERARQALQLYASN